MTDRQPVERHHRITNNNAIDLHVRKRLRLRRTLLGMSQEQLGAERENQLDDCRQNDDGCDHRENSGDPALAGVDQCQKGQSLGKGGFHRAAQSLKGL